MTPMLSREHIGYRPEIVRAQVDPGRLKTFRRALDSADFRNPLAPPTYLFALDMLEADRPDGIIEDLGIAMGDVLHGEQAFQYHEPVRAGDRLTFESVVADIFEKKGGALSFLVVDTRVTRDDGRHVADLRKTLVIRNS